MHLFMHLWWKIHRPSLYYYIYYNYNYYIIGADYVVRRLRYCYEFVMMYVWGWVGVWVYGQWVCTPSRNLKLGTVVVLETVSLPANLGFKRSRFRVRVRVRKSAPILHLQSVHIPSSYQLRWLVCGVCGVLCSGDQLRVCTRVGLTCCTADMESKLVSRTRSEFRQRISQALDQHRRTFANQTDTFNSTYVEALDMWCFVRETFSPNSKTTVLWLPIHVYNFVHSCRHRVWNIGIHHVEETWTNVFCSTICAYYILKLLNSFPSHFTSRLLYFGICDGSGN